MSNYRMLAIGVAFALATGAAQAQGTNSNSTSQPSGAASSMNSNSGAMQKADKADQKFLKQAVQGDLSEVKMGKLAQQNGESEDVKQYGQTLEQDHSQHLQKSQQMAQQMGVTPPTEPMAKAQKVYDRLSKEHGAKFDKAFAKAMVKDHKEDIAKYKKEAKKSGELGQFAQETVPTLEKHLKMAQSIENKGAMTGSKSGMK